MVLIVFTYSKNKLIWVTFGYTPFFSSCDKNEEFVSSRVFVSQKVWSIYNQTRPRHLQKILRYIDLYSLYLFNCLLYRRLFNVLSRKGWSIDNQTLGLNLTDSVIYVQVLILIISVKMSRF